ncbi:MAG: CU044_2847 family protein [Cyanobacteria bacterium P01_F01_bin.3]
MASQLIPIQLEDGTEIYIESTEDVNVSPEAQEANCPPDEEEEQVREGQKGGWGSGGSRGFNNLPGGNGSRQESGGLAAKSAVAASQSFKAIESTIRTYTNQTLSAFKNMADGNVDKVTLQFGIRMGGEAGVPYVTKGTAESNLSITVECSFYKD